MLSKETREKKTSVKFIRKKKNHRVRLHRVGHHPIQIPPFSTPSTIIFHLQMKFWGVEVEAGETLKVKLEDNMMLHLSQASLGKLKRKIKSESVPLFLKIDDQKLVLGTLSPKNHSQICFKLVFEKGFELYHNWKNGSVYFCGYILGSFAKPRLLVEPKKDYESNEVDDENSDGNGDKDDDDENSREEEHEPKKAKMGKKRPSEYAAELLHAQVITNEEKTIREKQETAKNKKNKKALVLQSITEKQKTAKNKKAFVSIVEPLFLPCEIIIEILTWLPVESLLRFKCVCKEWYSLIQDRHFITKHVNRARIIPFLVNASEVRTPNINGAIKETFTILSIYGGLVLQRSNPSQKYCIWNPATRQILDLPDPHMGHFFGIIICVVPSTGIFKLVCMCVDKEEPGNEGCEVLTLLEDLSWRPLNIPKSHQANKKIKRVSMVPTEGAIHCVREIDIGSNSRMEIESLDLESESFTSNTLPRGFFSDSTEVWALRWEGNLAFASIVEEELNVLVLEDYKKCKWGERKIIIPLRFMKENQLVKENIVPISADSNKLWFIWKHKKAFAYHMKLAKITETRTVKNGERIVYMIRPSLVTFKGVQPIKRRPQIKL